MRSFLPLVSIMEVRILRKQWLGVLLGIAGIGLVFGLYDRLQMKGRLERNSYPIQIVFQKAGLRAESEKLYTKAEQVTWVIHVDSDQLRKNGYQFPYDQREEDWLGRLYLPKDVLEASLGQELVHHGTEIELQSKSTNLKKVLADRRLIAHAGGTMREAGFLSAYSNSLQALKQNYSLGHRIFEFDLNLTKDGRLAAVHDWESDVPTAQDWEQSKTKDSNNIQAQYTTLFWEDILRQMELNPDMIVMTDTKVKDLTQKDIEEQYRILAQAVEKMNPYLAERILVQLYKPEDYQLLEEMGVFKHYILTLYASDLKEATIIQSLEDKPKILAVTLPQKDERLTDSLISQIHESNRLVLVHTVDGFATLSKILNRGIDGVYTNNLLSKDVALYQEVLDSQKSFDIEVYRK
ncbi:MULTISPECIES: glycerophosphodiester phosphodiesterase family protein [unclassified Streptococcus]|uniref:glycerophosphodiester phosphodiesterase family protein n=1 Tax=unclassified Streptococcus TaxID=2608887 RepID=UPI001072A1B3|nr:MULTISPECIES: glycerophosphodiester phosphodiesterase family protein [unclassified Streptococcus]MBF0806476.1 hypothetical protein [Streptococcus sp. 19428wA2_WM07]TFU27882.1 hypothetical protein E4T71_06740 [Streptococcus sp. WM07]